MPDPAQASRIIAAAKTLLDECNGQPYDVRRRFGMLIPILRGHKLTPESMKESPFGTIGRCEICEQVVRVPREGKTVEGLAVENDCPAAEWRRP